MCIIILKIWKDHRETFSWFEKRLENVWSINIKQWNDNKIDKDRQVKNGIRVRSLVINVIRIPNIFQRVRPHVFKEEHLSFKNDNIKFIYINKLNKVLNIILIKWNIKKKFFSKFGWKSIM